MDSTLLTILKSGIGGAIQIITEKVVSVAAKISVPEKAVYALGLVLAVLLGVLGYKYIKLVTTAVFGVAGYIIGFELFRMVNNHFSLDLPSSAAYVVGVVLLLALGYLSYKKFAYGMFGLAGVAGFLLAYFIYPNLFLAIAAAVLVAMFSMYFVRYAFVSILSVAAGFLFMGMVSAFIPTLKLVSLTNGFIGKLFAMLIACVFIGIQLSVTRKESTLIKPLGKKRVKIRRVFDTW